jgi:hypothetical protein
MFVAEAFLYMSESLVILNLIKWYTFISKCLSEIKWKCNRPQ